MTDSAPPKDTTVQKDTVVLQCKSVRRTYGEGETLVHALRNLDFKIHQGDFLVIAGSSGSGKTTLLNQLGALDVPDAGEVYLEGVGYSQLKKKALADLRRDRIGFVFQAYNLVPVLTALENAELTLLLQGVVEKDRRERIEELFETVGLAGKEHRFPRELSGGQQQRVAIVRALAPHPAFVLADEPTANLDSKTSIELIDYMRHLNETEGITFVFSSHDPNVIERAKRLVRLEDGEIVSDERVGAV
jgi:putative ABC transport system ATP-binding protein